MLSCQVVCVLSSLMRPIVFPNGMFSYSYTVKIGCQKTLMLKQHDIISNKSTFTLHEIVVLTNFDMSIFEHSMVNFFSSGAPHIFPQCRNDSVYCLVCLR